LLIEEMNTEMHFEDTMENHELTINDEKCISFLPKDILARLRRHYPGKLMSMLQFKKFLYTLDGPKTLELVKKTLEFASGNRVIDCSKSVVFILGNLDDAYKMSSSFNPDMPADDFHEE